MSEERTQEQTQAEGLTIQDLDSLRQIIDVASQRGAFKPGEMTQVGQTYNKLDNFLKEIAAQQKAQQEAQTEAQPQETQETPQGE